MPCRRYERQNENIQTGSVWMEYLHTCDMICQRKTLASNPTEQQTPVLMRLHQSTFQRSTLTCIITVTSDWGGTYQCDDYLSGAVSFVLKIYFLVIGKLRHTEHISPPLLALCLKHSDSPLSVVLCLTLCMLRSYLEKHEHSI